MSFPWCSSLKLYSSTYWQRHKIKIIFIFIIIVNIIINIIGIRFRRTHYLGLRVLHTICQI
jgi:hypothetical protein